MDKEQIAPIEIIKTLPDKEYELALCFINLGEELHLIPKTRYAPAHKAWKCVYSKKKPTRVIFTIQCAESKWNIKACLFHIDGYSELVENCSDEIKNRLRTAYDCRDCNSRCSGGCQFTLEGQSYRKCVGCCFYFSDLSDTDWGSLRVLIEKEAL